MHQAKRSKENGKAIMIVSESCSTPTKKFIKDSYLKDKDTAGENTCMKMEISFKVSGPMDKNLDSASTFQEPKNNSQEYGATTTNFMVSIKI